MLLSGELAHQGECRHGHFEIAETYIRRQSFAISAKRVLNPK